MGYRSEVMAAFYATKDRGTAVKLYVDENFPERLKYALEPIKNKRYVGYLFHETAVNSYDNYDAVQAFQRFVSNYLELAEQEEIRWAYEFVRIGEDSDDVEENHSYYANRCLYAVRGINSDF